MNKAKRNTVRPRYEQEPLSIARTHWPAKDDEGKDIVVYEGCDHQLWKWDRGQVTVSSAYESGVWIKEHGTGPQSQIDFAVLYFESCKECIDKKNADNRKEKIHKVLPWIHGDGEPKELLSSTG